MGFLCFSVVMMELYHNERQYWTAAAGQTGLPEMKRTEETSMRFTEASQHWTLPGAPTGSQELRVAVPQLELKKEAVESFAWQSQPWLPPAAPINPEESRKLTKTESMRRWREKMKRNPRAYRAYLEKQKLYMRKCRAKRKQNN